MDILNHATSIRRLREQAKAKAKELIPALFLDMFGDPATNPKRWEVAQVDEIVEDRPAAIRTGPFGSQLRHSEFVETGVPVLGIDNVVTNNFKWAVPRCLPPDKYERFKRFRVFPGDVLITIMGTTGRVCVAPDDLPECMSTKHLCVVTLDRGKVDPTYVWAAILHRTSIRSKSAPAGHGAIMEGWNMSIVRRLDLAVPPVELQRAFADRVADIQATIDQMDRAATAAEQLQTALMARLFDGG